MRNHRLAVVTVLVLATALSVGACGDEKGAGPSDSSQLDLVGRTFIGDFVTVNDKPSPLVKGSQLRVTFDDGSLGASAGCNSMGGDASWDDGVLIVTGQGLAMTEMACAEPLMQQDTWFADFLTSSPQLLQDDTTLTLTAGDTVIVLQDEEVVVPDASLTGGTWQLDSIIAGDAASSVPAGVESTVQFADDGELRAALGCNTGRGSYSVTGDTLSIEPLATTKMACEPPASDVESAVLGVLQGDVTFSIDGESLVLTAREATGSGASALVYRTS
jgi:heat shock protein HslJ